MELLANLVKQVVEKLEFLQLKTMVTAELEVHKHLQELAEAMVEVELVRIKMMDTAAPVEAAGMVVEVPHLTILETMTVEAVVALDLYI